jgi:soluble lytic murein transglycosylase-like protein
VALALAVVASPTTSKEIQLRAQAETATEAYRDLIEQHASEHGVDPALIMAVITVESRGNPNASSRAGAMGLMQLMPAVCQDQGVYDPYEPSQNIRGGVSLLARHLKKYKGDLQKTLAAYNAGPGRVANGAWKRIRETRLYVPKVLAYYGALRGNIAASKPAEEEVAPVAQSSQVLDAMYQVIYNTPNPAETETPAENWGLHEVAARMMAEVVAGKLKVADVQARAEKILAGSTNPPKSVVAVCLTTLGRGRRRRRAGY